MGFPSSSHTTRLLSERLSEFLTPMKTRVMFPAVYAAVVGLMVTPGHLDPFLGSIAILAIAAGAGAEVFNMYYDADIDGVMTLSAMRPISFGTVSRLEALVSGLVLTGGAVLVLGLAVNARAAEVLAFTIFLYIVVYTVWLKRRSPQNIVISGAAGALPPVIGWAASTGETGLEPLILFLIIFLWMPPHFWALSLNRTDEYVRAGVPMLPVVAATAATMGQILIHSVVWRGSDHQWSDPGRARPATVQEQFGRSARRSSPVLVLYSLPVRVVRSAFSGQQSVVMHTVRALLPLRRIVGSRNATTPGWYHAEFQSQGRRGLICGTL